MKHPIVIAALLALPAAVTPALAQDRATSAPIEAAETAPEARILFLDHGGIRDWRMGDSDTLYVQDRNRTWYEATLMRPVSGLKPQVVIGFDTGAPETFDRFSTVVIDGERYPVSSLVRLAGEPPADVEPEEAEG
jgi:hypothetical protein